MAARTASFVSRASFACPVLVLLLCLLAIPTSAADWQVVGVNETGTISFDRSSVLRTGTSIKAWVKVEPQKGRPATADRYKDLGYTKDLLSLDCVYLNSVVLHRLYYDKTGRLLGEDDSRHPYDPSGNLVSLTLHERVCATARSLVADKL